MNGEHQVIANQLDKANTEFREFERKDIKYRWEGVGPSGVWLGERWKEGHGGAGAVCSSG